MKIFLISLALVSTLFAKAQTNTGDVWLNEFHYDGLTNYGESDAGEFVEFVMKTSIATNPAELAKYKLVLFSAGANDNVLLTPGRGLPYNVQSPIYSAAETVHPLSGFQSCPSGTFGFTMLSKTLPILQDLPTGLALIYDDATIVQLLSYEKAFKISPSAAAGIPAAQTTTLITNGLGAPVRETALSMTNHSIALTGNGNSYSDFTWDDLAIRTATPCAVNGGQNLVAGVLAVKFLELKATALSNNIFVQWKVGDESKTAAYDIEFVEINGTKVGSELKDLSKAGTYSHTVKNLQAGIYNVRIKATEVDGSVGYSEIKRVKIGANADNLVINPNPAVNNNTTLQFIPSKANGYVLNLYNGSGALVYTQRVNGLRANQINIVPLKLQGIAAGIYNLQITNGEERYNVNLMKAE